MTEGKITLPGIVHFDGYQLTIKDWHAEVNSFSDLKELVLDYLKNSPVTSYVCNFLSPTHHEVNIINPPEIIMVNGKPQIICQICCSLYRVYNSFYADDNAFDLEKSAPKLFKYNGVPIYAHEKCFEKLKKVDC
jgi:hypothetical protein